MITIPINDLLGFVSQAIDAGIQSYKQSIDPHQDRIKQADAKRYLANLGYKPVLIKRWTELHLLNPVKSGEAQNAATWYSLSEIKKLLVTMKLKQLSYESDIRQS